MIKGKPLDFCLLIPCYNNFDGLLLSLQSVVYYPDRFMVLVVDDGSNVPVTSASIELGIKIDFPLFVLRNEMNQGITAALNNGLKWIEEQNAAIYIARLDCGDLCAPDRFYKQMDFMRDHTDVGLLGSWCVFEDKAKSFSYQYKTPTGHSQIEKAMHFRNVFIHPTVIFETGLLKKVGYYPSNFIHAEDYAFFYQLIEITHSHILDKFLVTCEINDRGISLRNRQEQLVSRGKIIMKYGTNPFLKIVGALRIYALRLLPKRLVLQLRKLVR
ncbi:MAG TPA: glycosyltransferase [Chitinophagaceae bacterium]|jgi:glycosyltransferase involved in cell wall biosynthesis|nr:glycosyltransferase [Chitinophagaceae bacterium]